ncbi:nitroreductase [Conyzicola nivalis]|uniref:Putative NAD(P)H nitroreductase n=1 Tax=Conyzicola nivalis TaxID=1477021 RepID=A0ABV2QNA8_9MICO
MSALDAVLNRHSHSKVTAEAPSRLQLLPLVEAAATVADHSGLKPWRLIELRGDARLRLGAAFAEATGATGKDAEKAASKPLRASLLIAVVFVHKPSFKVPAWEQEAVASGVAHMLSLLLDEAGWGVFWRSGVLTRSEPVHRMHELAPNEQLLGWLYVGGLPEKTKSDKRKRLEVGRYLTELT